MGVKLEGLENVQLPRFGKTMTAEKNAKQMEGQMISSAIAGGGQALVVAPVAVSAIGVKTIIGFTLNELKDEALSRATNGASDVLDITKQAANILKKGFNWVKRKLAKNADETTDVFRVYGGDSSADSFSWTPVNPNDVDNFRDVAGLPSGGLSGMNNSGRFVIEGTVKNADIIKKRPALPLDGNKGGLPELIIDPKDVNIKKVSGANPEF